jgi:hypothetical protein
VARVLKGGVLGNDNVTSTAQGTTAAEHERLRATAAEPCGLHASRHTDDFNYPAVGRAVGR